MTAMTLQSISRRALHLGLGASGPQVVEGWHGVPYSKPIQRIREVIEIVRMISSGEKLQYDGEIFHLPLPGGAGQGDPVGRAAVSRTSRCTSRRSRRCRWR